jgi:hypothetical protein
MTAPGNSTLLISLLIAFLACAGYAGGRLHQWYRTGHDRDEAYRDGYDTATRSVFSMAARIIVPKRSGSTPASTPDSADGTAPAAPTTSRRFRTGSFPFSRSAANAGFPAPEPFKVPPPAAAAPHAASTKRSSHSRTTGSAHSSAAAAAASAATPAAASDSAEGRHLVPDELVQAATFRLAPDRVARAKVRGAEQPPDPSIDSTSRASVPKPRSS